MVMRERFAWDSLLKEEAEFAGGAVGAEAVGEVKGGSGAGGDGGQGPETAEGEQPGGLVEAETSAELTGRGAEDTAAQGRVEGAEAVEFDRDGGLAGSGADGAASASNRFPGE
jgi:hypothetical protein